MKLNSLKGKIIAGTVAVGVVTSGGLVFANTDAGEQLRVWYDQAFGESAESVEAEVTAYGESLIPGLVDEYNGMKENATEDINDTRDRETASAQDAIESVKQGHLDNLNGTKADILENMNLRFQTEIYQPMWLEIQSLAAQAEEYATNDLTAHTGTKGGEAVSKVTEDLNTAKEEAVSELEDAIENAQAEIEAEMDNQEEMTASNLNNHIDGFIGDLRRTLDGLLEDLVQEQETIIADAAAGLETDAINALDEVVAGIGE